jgi:hypothetical protein
MEHVQATFIMHHREAFLAELTASSTVAQVKLRLEAALDEPVRQLKFQRRLLDDNELVSSLGLRPGAIIFVNPQVARRTDRLRPRADPQSAPVALPPRPTGWPKEAIEARIDRLTELGYARPDCDRALRAAWFNVDRAGEFLVSGSITADLTGTEADNAQPAEPCTRSPWNSRPSQ